MPASAAPIWSHVLNGWTHRHWIGSVALALVLALVFVLWTWGERAELRTLGHMAPVDRSALYEATRRYADTVCATAEGAPALEDRCADASEFLLTFPECDDACRAGVRTRTRVPAR